MWKMLSNPIWCVCRVPCLCVGLPFDIVFPDWNLWKHYSRIPETFNIMMHEGVSMGYPLWPGTLSLLASMSPSWLTCPNRVHQEHILSVSCKLAHPSDRYSSLSGFLKPLGTNLLTGTHEDQMESFALSESLKVFFTHLRQLLSSNHSHVVSLPSLWWRQPVQPWLS